MEIFKKIHKSGHSRPIWLKTSAKFLCYSGHDLTSQQRTFKIIKNNSIILATLHGTPVAVKCLNIQQDHKKKLVDLALFWYHSSKEDYNLFPV